MNAQWRAHEWVWLLPHPLRLHLACWNYTWLANGGVELAVQCKQTSTTSQTETTCSLKYCPQMPGNCLAAVLPFTVISTQPLCVQTWQFIWTAMLNRRSLQTRYRQACHYWLSFVDSTRALWTITRFTGHSGKGILDFPSVVQSLTMYDNWQT